MPGYVRSNPVTVTLPLDAGLNINQFLQQAPQGSLVTSITVTHVDPALRPTADSSLLFMSYGQQLPKQIFQGQCFTFGGYGDCIGVMDLGICLGAIVVAGGTVQLELCFYSREMAGATSAVASQ